MILKVKGRKRLPFENLRMTHEVACARLGKSFTCSNSDSVSGSLSTESVISTLVFNISVKLSKVINEFW